MDRKTKTRAQVAEELSPKTKSLQDTIREREATIRFLQKKVGDLERLETGMLAAVSALPPIKTVVPYKTKLTGAADHDAVLNLADLHAEESVIKEEMEGYAEYNFDIFKNRLWRVGEETIKRVREKRGMYPVSRLFVNMLGDMVTGEIHDDLMRTNTMPLPEATVRVSCVLGQLLMKLGAEFDEIQVKCVVGNHGRLDKKPSGKQKAKRNWDQCVYLMGKQLTAGSSKIKWEISEAPGLVYKVQGAKLLIKHGDEIKSTGVSPYYGIARDLAREQDKRRESGGFDYIMMGHWHHEALIEGKVILCPSMMGPNQHSFYTLHANAKPEQTLEFFTENFGRVDTRHIWLTNADHNEFVDG